MNSSLTTARAAVDLCTRAYNARRALPDRVNVGDRFLATGPFLRNLIMSSAAEDECAGTFMRDCTGQQPHQLGPQALQLAEAATAEGLLDGPARASAGMDPHDALAASNPYRNRPSSRPFVPPELVTVEPLRPGPAAAARATAEAASDERERRRYMEDTGRPRAFAQPEAAASGSMFDRSAFRAQSGAEEPAQVAEEPTRRERPAKA